MVTVSGTETGHSPNEPRSRGALLVVMGLVAGLTLGVLFSGGSPGEDPADQSVVADPEPPPTTRPSTTTTIRVEPSRLATMVPGLLDTLVTSAIDRTGAAVVTAWTPAARSPVVAALPWANLTADASRVWLAGVTPNRWTSLPTLWVGNAAYMEPVSTAVQSEPVWNTRLPGHLAWVDGTSDGPTLMIADFVAGQAGLPRPVATVAQGTHVVWWNDIGIVTRTGAVGRVTLELRGDSGEIERTFAAQAVLGAGRELIAVQFEGRHVLLDQNLNEVAGGPWSRDCYQVTFGPNGSTAQVRCASGDEQRIEYWLDVLTESGPTFVFEASDFSDFGFTAEGLPYAATIDPLRPTTAISFYLVTQGEVYEVAYPGRVSSLEFVRS